MRVGYSGLGRRDANEKPIVDALEKVGVKCRRIAAKGFCDVVAYRPDVGVRLLEIKSAKGKLTAAQVEHRQDGWPVWIVRCEADALALFGVTQ